MRIISGKYRGLKLAEFEGGEIRPTADRVKESLFNILYGEVAGARCLDLFCGSGNLGIECLSRGAAEVHFNDISPESVAVLKKNLSRLKGESGFKITVFDYRECLAKVSAFDLIFIDPPYKEDFGLETLKIIGERKLLKAGGIAVYERDRKVECEIGGLKLYDERRYGKTYLSFFKENYTVLSGS